MLFPNTWIPFVNIAVIAIFILFLGIGLYKGFLLMAVEFFSFIVTFILAYMIAPVLSASIHLASYAKIDVGHELLNDLIGKRINDLLWFVIVFVVLMVIFAVLRSIVQIASEIPVLKQVNALLGAVFGIAKAYAICLIAIFLLQTPLIANGSEVIQQTMLKTLEEHSVLIYQFIEKPSDINRAFQDLMNGKAISEQDMNQLLSWLQKQFSEQELQDIINQIHVNKGE